MAETGGLSAIAELAESIRTPLRGVLYGQEELIEGLLVALLSGGHVLLEGPPGVGKTLAGRSLAAVIGGSFSRIQCVPDLLPADITGSSVYRRDTATFEVRRGPVFANVVLADELNRATPRTQSGLLEAMAEGQVTIDGESLPLPRPHLVIATQNPLDLEGTYPLPLGQRDRFLFELQVGYPPPEREKALLLAGTGAGLDALAGLRPLAAGTEAWEGAAALIYRTVALGEQVADYICRLGVATRHHPDLEAGVSPRGLAALGRAARAAAVLDGRDFTTPDDVRQMWLPVCRHRIRPIPEVEIEGFRPDPLLAQIADEVAVPR